MQIFDADQTRRSLPMAALIDAVAEAAIAFANGDIVCPERLVVPLGPKIGADAGLLLSMPAVSADISVHKLISVMPGNVERTLPVIQGHLTVFDSATGTPRLLLDGPTVTGRRTAAVSLLAMRLLLPRAPRHVLLIGAGAQASHHIDALAEVYPGLRVMIKGRTAAAAMRLAAAHAQCGLALAVWPDTPGEEGSVAAISHDVDVVITCTTSRVPVYRETARAGRLLIAVGAFQAQAAEIDAATVRASRIVVDDPAGAAHEAGDLLLAAVDWETVIPLHAVLGKATPRPARLTAAGLVGASVRLAGETMEVPILFKSVGCAAWDLAAARVALGMAG